MADLVTSPVLDILVSPEPRIVDYFCLLLSAQLVNGTCDIGCHYVERIERRRSYHLTSTGIQHDFLLAYVKATSSGSLTPQKTYLVLIERQGAIGWPRAKGDDLLSVPRCAHCEPDLILSLFRSLLGPGSPPSRDALDTIQLLPDQSRRWVHSTCVAQVEFPAPGYFGTLSDPTEHSAMPGPSSYADSQRFPLYFYQLCLMVKRTHAQYKAWDATRMNCHFFCAAILHLTRLATRCPLLLRLTPQETRLVRWIDDVGRLGNSTETTKGDLPHTWRSPSWTNALIAWWSSPYVSIEQEPSNEMLRSLLDHLQEDISEYEPQASKLRRKVIESGRWNVEQRKWLRDIVWLVQEKATVLKGNPASEMRVKVQNDVERIAAQVLYILDTRNS